ncbi:hypothetical protein BVG16_16240 [Paenibacillus selenitireducens]|uniref:Uncharacterized protein n=1 Tax=Paenibacillus selenitireducens TaxID=1324314 RepID=A0A1T2X9Y8_9BACL|nr:hypothetical protein [Paenibacillus selenitireducens]OPA76719.1 hypothetical protein BVG16_16240 [Paenibacillus selenitireducens]
MWKYDVNSPEWQEEWQEYLRKIHELEREEDRLDLGTKKKRRITVTMTDKQLSMLQERAKDCNVSVDDILSNYIADLTCTHSNGSDERDRASSYFERTWLAHNRYL